MKSFSQRVTMVVKHLGTPKNISNYHSENNDSFSYQPSISAYGNNVYVVWHDDPQGERNIFLVKSNDGGQTFNTPVNISNNPGYSNDPINVNDILYSTIDHYY